MAENRLQLFERLLKAASLTPKEFAEIVGYKNARPVYFWSMGDREVPQWAIALLRYKVERDALRRVIYVDQERAAELKLELEREHAILDI